MENKRFWKQMDEGDVEDLQSMFNELWKEYRNTNDKKLKKKISNQIDELEETLDAIRD